MLTKILKMIADWWQKNTKVNKAKNKLKELDNERKKIADKEITSTADIAERKYKLSKNEGKRRRIKLDFANDVLCSQEYDCDD